MGINLTPITLDNPVESYPRLLCSRKIVDIAGTERNPDLPSTDRGKNWIFLRGEETSW
jgi:hypothetical protein